MAISWNINNNIDPTDRKNIDVGPANEFRSDINDDFIYLFRKANLNIEEIHDVIDNLDDFVHDQTTLGYLNTYKNLYLNPDNFPWAWTPGETQVNNIISLYKKYYTCDIDVADTLSSSQMHSFKIPCQFSFFEEENAQTITVTGSKVLNNTSASEEDNRSLIKYFVTIRISRTKSNGSWGKWVSVGDSILAETITGVGKEPTQPTVSYRFETHNTGSNTLSIAHIYGSQPSLGYILNGNKDRKLG